MATKEEVHLLARNTNVWLFCFTDANRMLLQHLFQKVQKRFIYVNGVICYTPDSINTHYRN